MFGRLFFSLEPIRVSSNMFFSTVRTLLKMSLRRSAPMQMPPTLLLRVMKPLWFAEEECVLLLTEMHRHRRRLKTLQKLPDYDNKLRNYCSNSDNRLSLRLSLCCNHNHNKWPQHPNKLVHMGDGQWRTMRHTQLSTWSEFMSGFVSNTLQTLKGQQTPSRRKNGKEMWS